MLLSIVCFANRCSSAPIVEPGVNAVYVSMEKRKSMSQPNPINYGAFQYYARLKRVKEHVDQYYSEEISLETAARIAATEKTYFSTFFHKKVGITFTDWLRQLRV